MGDRIRQKTTSNSIKPEVCGEEVGRDYREMRLERLLIVLYITCHSFTMCSSPIHLRLSQRKVDAVFDSLYLGC